MEVKPVIYSDLLRKRSDLNVHRCVVEKALAVSHEDFLELKNHPLRDNDLIAENVDLMYCDRDNNFHCLLIYDNEQGDGILIESEGYSYARYAQYVPQAKLIYEEMSQCTQEEESEEESDGVEKNMGGDQVFYDEKMYNNFAAVSRKWRTPQNYWSCFS